MAKAKKAKEGNDIILLIILVVYLGLYIGSATHDPILHGFIGLINGWELGEYESGLMTGQTTVMATAAQALNASIGSFWVYFMFPPLFIFGVILIASIIKPSKVVLVVGVVLQYLNLASVNPDIPASDASNAANFLITSGWQFPEWVLFALYALPISIIIYILLIKITPNMEFIPRVYTSFVGGISIAGILNYVGVINLSLPPETSAKLLHLIILHGILILWGLFLYVAIENNIKDARARIQNIVK